MQTAALVTTFNEAETIGPLVTSLLPVVDKVLVVDDARTTDYTEATAAAHGAETFVDLSITGIGPCLLAGLAKLRGMQVTVIDAGGSHSPEAIPFMDMVDADVVIGSRFVPGAKYEGRPIRKNLSRLYSKFCSVKTTYDIKDWTSGFRTYSPLAVRQVLARPPTARMHGFQPQALAACLAGGLKVREYPITYRAGRTSMNRHVAAEATRVLGRLSCS